MNERLRLPAEWEPHRACWLAFPYLEEEWPSNLEDAQSAIASLCCLIAGPGNEAVRLLVKDDQVEERARSLIGDLRNIHYVKARYGDCWMRDTAPLLGHRDDGSLAALCFDFNGWGGKYEMPFDAEVSEWLTAQLGAKRFESRFVLEGGALDSNGEGTILSTVSCVLNPNRNPGLTRDAFEKSLGELLRLERLIWMDGGLEHDHTDGHVDMIARFVSADTVATMRPSREAPNADVLTAVRRELRANGLNLLDLPAPRALAAPDGSPLPASYCNFYIANEAVIVPTYGFSEDEIAIAELANAFPGREVIGLQARDLLWGGGAFHCSTQAQPIAP